MSTGVKKKKRGWRIQRDSYHKLCVRFEDGNKRTRYSIDWRHAYSKTRDPAIGFVNFRRMIKRWGARGKYIVIYNLATDSIVAKYYKNQR